MGLSFWIYIIISIVVVIVRQMQKSAKNNPPPGERPRNDDDHGTDNKPMTFEELLREIQASKTPPQPAKTIPARPLIVNYDDDIPAEEKSLETIPARDDTRSFELYENAKREAFNRPSLEETMKWQDTVMQYRPFKEYETTSKRSIAKEVVEELKDPEGFRKAFIMSEILKRKF